MMTNKQYAEYNKGLRCPACGSTETQASPIEADGDTAWSTVKCFDCDEAWRDLYRLVGYEQD